MPIVFGITPEPSLAAMVAKLYASIHYILFHEMEEPAASSWLQPCHHFPNKQQKCSQCLQLVSPQH